MLVYMYIFMVRGLSIMKLRFEPYDIYNLGYRDYFEHINKATVTNAFIYAPDAFFVVAEVEWSGKPDIKFLRKLEFFEEIEELSRDNNTVSYLARGRNLEVYAEILDIMTREFFCFFEYPMVYAPEGVYVQIVGRRRDLKRFADMVEGLDIVSDVVFVKPYHIRGRAMLSELTDRQLELLKAAHEHGYYNIPKGTDLRELAKIKGITHGALAFHLRKAHRTILQALLG